MRIHFKPNVGYSLADKKPVHTDQFAVLIEERHVGWAWLRNEFISLMEPITAEEHKALEAAYTRWRGYPPTINKSRRVRVEPQEESIIIIP